MDENHPPIAQSPYAASKTAADQLAISYFRAFNLPIKILRPFNTFGPRQSTRAIIPTIITQLLGGQEPIVLGSLSPKRDFVFVRDVCQAYLETHKSKEMIGETVNIGMGSSVSVLNLAEKIMELMGKRIEIQEGVDRFRPCRSEVWDLVCNNSKIKEKTNWRPTYTIDSGLSEAIDWYRIPGNLEVFKIHGYSI